MEEKHVAEHNCECANKADQGPFLVKSDRAYQHRKQQNIAIAYFFKGEKVKDCATEKH
ncbi:hypothetical protein KDI_10310 [Dictyobacter arantiisoli]|uniref:Uncharacterized protein n=1 Tax=Dictyobacter arantiisoli TaxID=2014874 RepID=A0A5A5T7T9_9CHLR|nr:hypothetical protein KDI_10310 [Dictyobacter arantiisoli]